MARHSLNKAPIASMLSLITHTPIPSQQSRIAALKASFDQSPTKGSSHHRNNKLRETQLDADIPEHFVSTNKQAWDKIIGEWVFDGISQTPMSPAKPKMRRPSSEVRVPTPLSTPLGSTDNLWDSGSRCVMLSNSPLVKAFQTILRLPLCLITEILHNKEFTFIV